jgi:parvulin-like peptidyl-prolyl isomerase
MREPERRRVLHIAVGSLELAKKIAEEAQGASGEKWAELATKHSVDRRGTSKNEAVELAGDLGLVSAPGSERGDNPLVAEPLRKAVFSLGKLGDVTDEPVVSEGLYHVVRHGGVSAARDRSFQDAERLIRVELVRQKFLEKEAQLEKELRTRFPVKIDEEAVKKVKPEKPSTPAAPVPPPTAPGSTAPGSPAKAVPAPSAPAPTKAP